MNKQEVNEPFDSAPPEVKRLLKRVIKAEKDKLYTKRPRGINEDILRIIKEEIE
ncbi:MAG: hypothetical protein ACO3NK_05095 [Prochlorotrichaceae cyanobacterium]|jgi:hypothetical protein